MGIPGLVNKKPSGVDGFIVVGAPEAARPSMGIPGLLNKKPSGVDGFFVVGAPGVASPLDPEFIILVP
jgi:hypothetical protein